MTKPKLLIVDDDKGILTQMKWALASTYTVFLTEDRSHALEIFRKERPPVITLDLGLPPKPDNVNEGFFALEDFLEIDPFVKVIVITGHDEKRHALRSIGQGGYDFFYKPICMDELKVVLHRAFYLYRVEKEHQELLRQFKDNSFEGMFGTSEKMKKVFTTIRKVATTDAPVLFLGESGTGKELAAKAIHRLSNRKKKPFVTINCGAIPENLLESELFGHEKGAFTGAHIQRKGRIEKAHEGTLFLDEIGELPMLLQVKLLRFLQEKKIERLGGRDEILVDTRIIAATNVDLQNAMNKGTFREDLYYRLRVVVITIPPIREREGDIMLLATIFLQEFTFQHKKKITGFTKSALKAIENHEWYGNIRELKNRIKRAVIMAEGKKIKPEDLELMSAYAKYSGLGLKKARENLERDLILHALSRNKGNITKASGELEISRPAFYDLMDKLGIIKK